jgi:hypothetical protein
MIRHILYDGQHRGWFVAIESYYGEQFAAFFWTRTDAENWNPL